MNDDIRTLVLLDASNLIYRAHFAMKAMGRAFSAPDGTPTGGLSTYLRMVESISKKFPGSPVVAVHEHPGGSFRDAMLAEYKAHRPPTEPELKIQLRLAMELLPLLGVPSVNAEGFEADDLLCAYAVKAAAEGWRVVMVTSDKDMGQVVTDSILIIDPADKEMNLRGPAEVEARMGVPPSKVIEFLALMGDAVDGIPGVRGVGKKTAAKLLNEKGSVAAILADVGSMSQAMQTAFAEAGEMLPKSVELATARLDAPLPMTVDEISSVRPDWQAALPLLERLAFKSWMAKARAACAHKP